MPNVGQWFELGLDQMKTRLALARLSHQSPDQVVGSGFVRDPQRKEHRRPLEILKEKNPEEEYSFVDELVL